uniref:lasso peptide biosynthesis B2 protein n=1 Tax=uncultured Sphingomonas sp. TaxID=158754 RepID=UPI0035CAD2F6
MADVFLPSRQLCRMIQSMVADAVLTRSIADRRATRIQLLRRLAILSLVPPCCVLLAVSSIVIAAIPLRRLVIGLGQPLGAVRYTPIASAAQARRARILRSAVGIAARLVPFRSDCYPQALTVLALCSPLRIPTALHFGARAESAGDASALRLAGHVWVVAGAVPICGGQPCSTEFASVACFFHRRDDRTPTVARAVRKAGK